MQLRSRLELAGSREFVVHFTQLVRVVLIVLKHIVQQCQRLVGLAVLVCMFMGVRMLVCVRGAVVFMRMCVKMFVLMPVLVAMIIVRTRSPRFYPNSDTKSPFLYPYYYT